MEVILESVTAGWKSQWPVSPKTFQLARESHRRIVKHGFGLITINSDTWNGEQVGSRTHEVTDHSDGPEKPQGRDAVPYSLVEIAVRVAKTELRDRGRKFIV